MCGINGFINYNKDSQTLIQKMNKKIQHRGPDGEGFYLDENISLGHRRLSIIDLSENGKQPMFNEDKSLCLIFNGEIYNFEEIRNNLKTKGHRFFSNTDSEVILHLFEDHKEDCVKFLNGIFVFAVWDIKNKELFLARDRIGVKPLYYYWDPSNSSGQAKFIFSSEIKAILEHNIKREINPEALNHYFRLMYVPAPLTMFKNIYKLPQAHYLKLSLGNAQHLTSNIQHLIHRYWSIEDFRSIDSKDEIIGKIQVLMRQSVKGQLISDRPVGMFLSGGIDSTSVLGVAREFKKDKIKTFSVGFDVDDPNNKFNADLGLARETAKFYNTEHHELLVSSKDILENIEKVIYHLDEPIAEPTQIATFLLSEMAKKEVAVVLGGDGGDELFGGYKRYYYSYMLSKYLPIVPSFLKTRIYAKFMFQKEQEIAKIINKDVNQVGLTNKFFKDNYFGAHRGAVGVSKERFFMLTDLNTWLVDESLMRTDKMTMAHGLEQRVPILDHYLVELSAKIPGKYKMASKEQGKAIFIEAMKQYLPEHILKSNKKKVWLTPMSEWLRRDLNGLAKEVLLPDYCSQAKDYFDFNGIKSIFDDHIEKRQYNLNLIWAMITFQIWCKQYL